MLKTEKVLTGTRPKSAGRVRCIPKSDNLPLWGKLPLDVKLPMIGNPRGKISFCRTEISEPKNMSWQKIDFDLRDPKCLHIDHTYDSLTDPYLKSYFKDRKKRRFLREQGLISTDGRVLCSLKEFNRYRQHIRYAYLLEVYKQRNEEREARLQFAREQREARKLNLGYTNEATVRRSYLRNRDEDLNSLRRSTLEHQRNVSRRLHVINKQLQKGEDLFLKDEERRRATMEKWKQMNTQRQKTLEKQAKKRERYRYRLMLKRARQKRVKNEIEGLERWKKRSEAQRQMIEQERQQEQQKLKQHTQNVIKRNNTVNKHRKNIDKKIADDKQKKREQQQKFEEKCSKRLEEKREEITNSKKQTKVRKKPGSPNKIKSTWKIEEELQDFTVPDPPKIERIHSVRFSRSNSEIQPIAVSSLEVIPLGYRPTQEHISTPCASSSTSLSTSGPPVSFSETLLIRLLHDVKQGNVTYEDLATLASSVDANSYAVYTSNADSDSEVSSEDRFSVGSDSTIAERLVDFTLNKILNDINHDQVHEYDLASLSVSLMDNVSGTMGKSNVSLPNSNFEDISDRATQLARAVGDGDITPDDSDIVDEVVMNSLQDILNDMKNERISKDDMKYIAQNVTHDANQTDKENKESNGPRDNKVLQKLLEDLKEERVDQSLLEQVVLSIINSYNRIKSWTPFENRISDAIKLVLKTFETKIVDLHIEDVDLDKLETVNNSIADYNLNQKELMDLTDFILDLIPRRDDDTSQSPAFVIENILTQVTELLQNGNIGSDLCERLNSLVDEVMVIVRKKARPLMTTELFVNFLTQLKTWLENRQETNKTYVEDINDLLKGIDEQNLTPEELLDLASAVVNVARSTHGRHSCISIESDISQSLDNVLNELGSGEIEVDRIGDMVHAIRSFSVGSEHTATPISDIRITLKSIFQNVLDNLIYQLKSETLTPEDVIDLADNLKENVLYQIEQDEIKASPTLLQLQDLVEDLSRQEMSTDKVYSIGESFVEYGQRVLGRDLISTEDRQIPSRQSLGESMDSVTLFTKSAVSKDIVNFVQIVLSDLRLQLSDGSISPMAVIHFCRSIAGGDTEELSASCLSNATEELGSIIKEADSGDNNIVERVLDLYLSPHQSRGALSDPMRAVEVISSRLSYDLAKNYVIKALKAALSDIRRYRHVKKKLPATVHVIKSAARIIAERLVVNVLDTVKKELPTGINTNLRRTGMLEEAIVDLYTACPDYQTCISHSNITISPEVQDTVLEALHDVVFKVIREKSNTNDDKDSHTILKEFVYLIILNIAGDYFEDCGMISDTSVNYVRKQTSNEVKVQAYITNVMLRAIDELKEEIKAKPASHSILGTSQSPSVEMTILEHIQKSLTDPTCTGSTLSADQLDDVKTILVESIRKTTYNIRAHKFSPEDLRTLFQSASRVVDEHDTYNEKGPDVCDEEVINMMEDALDVIQDQDMDETDLKDMPIQVATLGMDSPAEIDYDAPPSSTMIQDMVTDVITRVTESVQDEIDEEIRKTENNNNLDYKVTKSEEEIGTITQSYDTQDANSSVKGRRVIWDNTNVEPSTERKPSEPEKRQIKGKSRFQNSVKAKPKSVIFAVKHLRRPKSSGCKPVNDRVQSKPTRRRRSSDKPRPKSSPILKPFKTGCYKDTYISTSYLPLSTFTPKQHHIKSNKATSKEKSKPTTPETPKPKRVSSSPKKKHENAEPCKASTKQGQQGHCETKNTDVVSKLHQKRGNRGEKTVSVTPEKPPRSMKMTRPRVKMDHGKQITQVQKDREKELQQMTGSNFEEEIEEEFEEENVAEDEDDDTLTLDLSSPCSKHKMEVVFRRDNRTIN